MKNLSRKLLNRSMFRVFESVEVCRFTVLMLRSVREKVFIVND